MQFFLQTVTNPKKNLPFSKWHNWPKSNKNKKTGMFEANNLQEVIRVISDLNLPAGLAPKLLQHDRDTKIHSKTDLSHANNIHKKIFSLKSVEKYKYSASAGKTTFFQTRLVY